MPKLTESQEAKLKILQKAIDIALDYHGPEVPELGNQTKFALVDDLGIMKAAIKILEKPENIIKERFKSMLEPNERVIHGDRYKGEIAVSERTALDQTAAKAKLLELGGQEALDACMKTTEVETLRVGEL